MFKLILSLILTIFGSCAWASCEDALYHNVTRVSLKLYAEGKISREKLVELSQSEHPINPFRHTTPLSGTASASRFFTTMIASGLEKEWPRICAELISELGDLQKSEQAVAVAKDDTHAVIAFNQIGKLDGRGYISRTTKLDGKNYFLVYDPEREEYLFYDLWRKEPIFQIYDRTLQSEVHFHMDEQSGPAAKVFLLTGLKNKLLWRKNRAFFEVTTINLVTGNAETENLSVDLPDKNPPKGIQDIIRGFLKPISLAKGLKQPDITGLQTRFDRIYGSWEFTSASGRHLIAVVSVGLPMTVEVFEPARSNMPLMRYGFGGKIVDSSFEFVEWKNRIYLLSSIFDRNENLATLSVFEPDDANQPITSMRADKGLIHSEISPDGELVVALNGSIQYIYSIFNRP